MLDDGTYDALVVDASPVDAATWAVDLTIVAGARKGDVVTVRAQGLPGDPIDLLGIPATLTVSDGQPSVQLER